MSKTRAAMKLKSAVINLPHQDYCFLERYFLMKKDKQSFKNMCHCHSGSLIFVILLGHNFSYKNFWLGHFETRDTYKLTIFIMKLLA